jgi:hypothetical protein
MEFLRAVMRAKAKLLTVCACLLLASTGWAEPVLVLVTHADSPITDVSNLDVRKVFLGIETRQDGNAIHGVRNKSDEKLNAVFMQYIVAMSERSYQRRLLSFTMRYGRPRPLEVSNSKQLVDKLSKDPHAISYMWLEEAEALDNIKILRVIWGN